MLAWFRKPEYLLQTQDLDLSVKNMYSPAAAMLIFSSDHVLTEETKHRKEKQHSTHGIGAMHNMYA